MRWNHSHSWAAGVVTGIVVDQHAVLLLIAGGISGYLFTRLGAVIRGLTRRWAIRP